MYRIMLSLLILVSVFSITACNTLGILQSTPSPAEREAEEYAVYQSTPSPAEREAEEYAVYRTLLEESEERCIHSLTITSGNGPKPSLLDSESFPDLDVELIEDYNQALQESVPFNPDLLGEPVTLLNGYDEWPCMFIQGFSRVGFNKRMDEALAYHESKAPLWALAGGGELIYLVKGQDGSWKIEWDQRIWIS